jgi:oxepin-CoA hydrolase/3-oxo-5,6-dehydrosuberyl-CoA semialdehyde dehydrogenase
VGVVGSKVREGQILTDAVTSVPVSGRYKGLDFPDILQYGRTVGNPALRRLTFHDRGRI